MHILQVIHKLEAFILPYVIYFTVGLAAFLLLLFALYLFTTFEHTVNARYSSRKEKEWRALVGQWLSGKLKPEETILPRQDHAPFHRLLLELAEEGKGKDKARLSSLYARTVFYQEDLKMLSARSWWRRLEALERLEDMEVKEAEAEVLPLVHDRRPEVSHAAMLALVAIDSEALAAELPKIFEENERHSYRLLVNIIAPAHLPARELAPLAESPDRDYRKAAAIILGNSRGAELLPMLGKLAADKVKDVRREAVRSLARSGDSKAVPLVAAMAGDVNPEVREETARGLGRLQDEKGVKALGRLAGDKEAEVRYQAFFSLSRLGPAGWKEIKKQLPAHPELANKFMEVKG